LEKVVAAHFVQGIRNRNIRMMVAVNSQNKSDYTFSDVYQAVQAVYRAMEEDSESESDSELSSSTDSSVGGSRRHHDAKKAEEHKATEVEEVKRPDPESTQVNMDDLTKFIKENVRASTRKLVGSYGMAPNPTHILGQPPQATMIESYAVSSQSRPQFSGRSYPYQQAGGFQQQQRYQPPYRRSTDNSRPVFMEPYSAQDARSSGQPQPPTVTTPQNPRISEANLVKEMTCSSALDGVTVRNG
jgi:hypothetical protein